MGAASCQGFEVRAHDPCDAASVRSFDEPFNRTFAWTQVLAQRLDGDIETDLVSVLEAVGDCFLARSDANVHPFELVGLDAVGQGDAGEADDAERGPIGDRLPGLYIDRHPDFVRNLRTDAVKTKCGEQAYDAMRNARGRFHERMVLRNLGLRGNVEPSAYPLDVPRLNQAGKLRARETPSTGVAAAEDPLGGKWFVRFIGSYNYVPMFWISKAEVGTWPTARPLL